MTDPRFSVIIPTRNRAETLRVTLRSCTEQDFDPFEIVVSDNDSKDDTRAVVEAAGSSHIRYVKTPRALSMAIWAGPEMTLSSTNARNLNFSVTFAAGMSP